jgi:hypothetical protein
VDVRWKARLKRYDPRSPALLVFRDHFFANNMSQNLLGLNAFGSEHDGVGYFTH